MKKDIFRAGYSLIEVMIATSLVSVAALGLMQLFDLKAKKERTERVNAEIENFVNDFRSLIQRDGYCTKSLERLSVQENSTTSFEALKTPRGTNRYQIGEPYYDNSFKINAFEIKNFQKESRDSDDGPATLRIAIEKLGPIFGGRQITRSLEIYIARDASGAVHDCLPLSAMSSTPKLNFEGIENFTEEQMKELLKHQGDLKQIQKSLEALLKANEELEKAQESF